MVLGVGKGLSTSRRGLCGWGAGWVVALKPGTDRCGGLKSGIGLTG